MLWVNSREDERRIGLVPGSRRIPRIGYLIPDPAAAVAAAYEAFRAGLRDLGYGGKERRVRVPVPGLWRGERLTAPASEPRQSAARWRAAPTGC